MKQLHYKLLALRLALLLSIYAVCRLWFWLANRATFAEASPTQIMEAMLKGLRFDVATICWINAPFILFSILPIQAINKQGYQRFLRLLFLCLNFPFLLLNLIDIDFFAFTGRRTSSEILRLAPDVSDQAPQLLLNYWYIPLAAVVFVFILNYLYPRYKALASKELKLWPAIAAAVGIALLTGLGIRSSVAIKPLQAGHAFNITPAILGNVVLNTPFVFLKNLDNEDIERVNYFPSNEEVIRLIVKKDTAMLTPTRQNVVVIIVESCASEYMSLGNSYAGYTPFLDSLARKGLFFKNHYANGRRSIEAMSAIMAGVPSLMGDAYISSKFQTNHLYGLGSALHDNGYETAFFHGGRNGTMNFDMFAGLAGFSRYYGMSQYPNSDKDYDGNWGIFDEPFLQFTAQKLSEMQQPFGVGIFTLSSHQPYTIPAQHVGRFPKGTLPIHESLGYADYALRQFFRTAAKQPWYENTIFVITADHTQESEKPEYQHELARYDVPLIWFQPQKKLPPADTNKLVQHLDISPSVLHCLGITPRERLAFGQSVFANNTNTEIVNFSDGHYLYQTKNHCLRWFTDGKKEVIDIHTQQVVPNNDSLAAPYEQRLKAYLQYYYNGLLDNNWYHFGAAKP